MKYGLLIKILPLAFLITPACQEKESSGSSKRDPTPTQGRASESVPNPLEGWNWTTEKIADLLKRARAGDVPAAKLLYQYYTVHEDKVNQNYWRDWLFKRGDQGAIRDRALSLYSSAKRRQNNDPVKLHELREAERLWISVKAGANDDPFLQRLRSEMMSAEKLN